MSSLEVKAKLRREQDILDRIENVNGKAFGAELINDLSEMIQLQLLSVVALCNGDNPDLGEPCPMLEWQSTSKNQKKHPEDRFYDMWKECLRWNA